jgi:hypothetical protein
MKGEEFVKSGSLELYCMGLLSDAEKKEIESILIAYPSLKEELNGIERNISKYCEVYNPGLEISFNEIESEISQKSSDNEKVASDFLMKNKSKEGSG